MKTSTRLVCLLFLIFVAITALAQTELEGKKTIYPQLGASEGIP